MAWNNLTTEQMEAQMLRQAQTIGRMREALQEIADMSPGSLGAYGKFAKARILAHRALGSGDSHSTMQEEKP